ncbi:MAG: hypothetical protein WC825_02900 [Gallionellaceae bacterium]|jgi:hypothetical protein
MDIIQTTIQYASWPIVVLIGLFLFKKPIREMISNLRSLKAGSLEASFTEGLSQQGLTDIQLMTIRSLSPADIDIFLLVSFSDSSQFNYSIGMDTVDFKNVVLRLQDAGLLEITSPKDAETNIRHNTTPIGKSIRAMLLSSTMRLLHTKK